MENGKVIALQQNVIFGIGWAATFAFIFGGGLRTFALCLFGWMLGVAIGIFLTEGRV